MAKKSSKHQSKRENVANSSNTTTESTINGTTDTLAAPASSTISSEATRVAFREFIELADRNAIKNFIALASLSPEGENLKLLWGRAFKEGLIAGHQLYGKTEERLKEVYIDGHDKGFQAGYDDGRRDEPGDWILDGHGMHCGYEATAPCEDASTQTDLTADTTVISASTVAANFVVLFQQFILNCTLY